jgi:predicted PurR-regulated permease PerM
MSDPNAGSRFPLFFIIACFLLLGYLLFLVFQPFLSILIWATVLAVVGLPLFHKILRLFRGRRALASLVTCLLIVLVIVLPVTILGIMIAQQSITIYHNLQANVGISELDSAAKWEELQKRPSVQWFLNQSQTWFGAKSEDIQGYVKQVLTALSRFIVTKSPSLLAGFGGMVASFFLVFITMYFLFRDGPILLEIVRASNPLPPDFESEIIQKFQDVSYATFVGSILTAIVQGIAAALLFWMLGVSSSLFWGAVVSFVALIPILGGFIVWIPMSAYLYLSGQTTRAIILLAVGGLVVSSIDNILKPILIQGRTKMHPLLVFLSVLGGMQVFGFLGILLGPLIVAISLSFLNLYRLEFRDSLSQKSPAEK